MSDLNRNAKEVEQELAVHDRLKYTVVALWCIFYSLFGLVQSGSLTHISVYCTEYLHRSIKISRYLITVYGAGLLTSRVLIAIVPNLLQKVISSNVYRMCYLMVVTMTMACLTAIWLFVPFEVKLYVLYFVFPALGFFLGGLDTYVVHLVESVSPVSGIISCIFGITFSSGDFMIVSVNQELMQKYGAMIQPVAICTYCLLMALLLALTMFLHRRYQRIRTEIMVHSDAVYITIPHPESPKGSPLTVSSVITSTDALPAETTTTISFQATTNEYSKSSETNSAGTVSSMTISIDHETIKLLHRIHSK